MSIESIKNYNFAEASKEVNRSLLEVMIWAREADERENMLFRQGRAQLHVSSAGHEAIAGIALHIQKQDAAYCYYRDRALMLGMGVPLYDLALDFFAKKQSSSAGRQMANHFSYKPLNIMPAASPTGLQCLPAAGSAWAFKRDKTSGVVFCFMGEACTRQGEFFEALAFSLQEKLPIIFIVEDNGYGISTATENITPLRLGMLPKEMLHVMEGRDPSDVYNAFGNIVAEARYHEKPKVVWLKLDRLMSHTSSDDHAKYRKREDLERIKSQDPVLNFKNALINAGEISQSKLLELEENIRLEVKRAYSEAEAAEEPDVNAIREHIFSPKTEKVAKSLKLEDIDIQEWRMSSAVNYTLDTLLNENGRVLLFGEDIEDPKGGVFGLTRGLAARYPGRVLNSPLAEATIAGLASGLSMAGVLPIFELQFIDFVGPAFHQIVNQIATLRWRSAGQYKCPLIIYAPCGGYIANGGPWHSQTNESWFAHTPGLKVYMPSDANNAAHMLYHAAYGEDPVLLLLPKNQFQVSVKKEIPLKLYPEKARIKKAGEHVTLISWGNCTGLAMGAQAYAAQKGVSVEVIDLCSIAPCDWPTIHQSVRKTGRLVVVQEDGRTCSFGQAIISEVLSNPDTWKSLHAAPQLVTKEDIYIGFNKHLEAASLPNLMQILEKINLVLRGEA